MTKACLVVFGGLLSTLVAGCGSDVTDDFASAASTSGAGTASSAGGAGAVGGAASVSTTGPGAGPGSGGAGASGVGPGGAGGEGGGGCASLGDPCTDCLSSQCQAVYCNCLSNAQCGALVQCFGQCMMGDQACNQACLTAHEDGISDAYVLGDCSGTVCMGSCKGGNSLKPCGLCLFTKCEPVMNQCLANPDCTALIQCLQACDGSDPTCPSTCAAQFPGGTTDAQAVGTCKNQSCASECP